MNRFLKLFKMEWTACLKRAAVPITVFLGIYLMLWLFNSFIIGTVCHSAERWDYFRILTFLFCLILPVTLYGYVGESGKGVFYLLLPVSVAEKYAVMLLDCVLFIPISYILLQAALDSVLVLAGGEDWGYVEMLSGKVSEWSADCLSLVFSTSFFVVGNLLFNTHRTMKTFVLLMAVYIIWRALKRPLAGIGAGGVIMGNIAVCIGIAALWVWGYFRLRILEAK